MQLPADFAAVLSALRSHGRPLLVGGCVRDWLLGLDPKDFDVEVHGIEFDTLHRVLAPFGATDVVGRSFGVIKLRLGSAEYDFALPRRDSKTGRGHRGFVVQADPTLDIAAAASRRDFTVNAIAYDPFTEALFDPFDGQRDLHARRLCHVSEAFAEDPLRVLRGFQLAARFGLTLAPSTAQLCREIAPSYRDLPVERVWSEWAKWAEKSAQPSKGLAVLQETGWLVHFPELAALVGVPQDPTWHPEGDVFVHTALCCDALVTLPAWQTLSANTRTVLLLATLAHDFGKPATTAQTPFGDQLRWTSRGHESAGVAPTESFLRRIGCPADLSARITPLVANHLVHHHGGGEFSDTFIRRLARRLAPATIEELCLLMEADHNGRPPLKSPASLALIARLRTRALELALAQAQPRPILGGRHLVPLGLKPGPAFKPILDAAFEAQLEGAFTDESTGLSWLQNHLREFLS